MEKEGVHHHDDGGGFSTLATWYLEEMLLLGLHATLRALALKRISAVI